MGEISSNSFIRVIEQSTAEAEYFRTLARDGETAHESPIQHISAGLVTKWQSLGLIHKNRRMPTPLQGSQELADMSAGSSAEIALLVKDLESRETELSRIEVNRIIETISDELMRIIIASNVEREFHRSNFPQLPLPYEPEGQLGNFLGRFGDDKVKQNRLANIVAPFFGLLNRLQIALRSATTNKIILSLEIPKKHDDDDDDDDDDNDHKKDKKRRAFQAIESYRWMIVKECLQNFPRLTGDPNTPEFHLIDMSFLSHVLGRLDNLSEGPAIIFYLLKYAFTGKTHPILTAPGARIGLIPWRSGNKRKQNRTRMQKFRDAFLNTVERVVPRIPFVGVRLSNQLADSKVLTHHRNRRQARQKKSILEMIRMRNSPFPEFQRDIKKTGGSAVLFIDGTDKTNERLIDTFLQFLEETRLEKDPFFDRLMRQPAIIVGEPLAEGLLSPENYAFVRNLQFPANAFPRPLARIVGTTEEEQQLWEFADLLDAISDEMGIEGMHYPLQLKESAQTAYGIENPTQTDMLRYFLETCPALSMNQVEEILDILFQYGFGELANACGATLQQRFGVPEFMLARFARMTAAYKPDMLTTMDTPVVTLLSSPRVYLQRNTMALGANEEMDFVITALRQNDGVAILDGTQYSYAGEKIRISDRIVAALVERIMSGDIPEELQHYSVVAFQEENDTTKKLIAFFFGNDEQDKLSEADVRDALIKLKNYNDKILFVINAKNFKGNEAEFETQVKRMIRFLTEYDLKVLVITPKVVPGIPALHIPPITEENLQGRLVRAHEALEAAFELKIDESDLRKLALDVHRSRAVEQDPLALCIQILETAAAAARASENRQLTPAFINQASAAAFSKIDIGKIKFFKPLIEGLPHVLNQHVIGQDHAVGELQRLVQEHLTGLRDARRPLAVLLPGPTGVGKTMICEVLEKHMGFPVLKIDGTQYKEPHSTARLVGSPPGYEGEKEGVLSKFLAAHTTGVVFFDEIDKMHPDVLQFVMNFIDKGEITSGAGNQYRRPAIIILGATNAGADSLNPGMSRREIQEILAGAFADEKGRSKPELIGRWTSVVPMLGLEETAFRQVIAKELLAINDRPGMMARNVEIVEVEEAIIDLIFQECREVCLWKQEQSRIGFAPEQGKQGGRGRREFYFNLRQINDFINRTVRLDHITKHTDGTRKTKMRVCMENKEVMLKEI